MGSNVSSEKENQTVEAPPGDRMEMIKRQLAWGTGSFLLQGPLLKRSDFLKKWNERWVILNPTTGKIVYKRKRSDLAIRGCIIFDANSTITLSPVNFRRLPKYNGCFINIETPEKKNYFFCAETPGAAWAWVSALRDTQLVLKAHKEAEADLKGKGPPKLVTIETVVAAANWTALESSEEIEAAMEVPFRNAPMDDLTIMKETLHVKEEELLNLAQQLHAHQLSLKKIEEKFIRPMVRMFIGNKRSVCYTEVELEATKLKLEDWVANITEMSHERYEFKKQIPAAVQEVQLWNSEVEKAKEHVVILEEAVVRAEEKARVAEADAQSRIKEAVQKESVALRETQELLARVNMLQAHIQSQQIDTQQVSEEKTDSCSNSSNLLTKDVDFLENLDKARLSVSRGTPQPGKSIHDRVVSEEVEWSDLIPATEAIKADVREVATDTKGCSLDISDISPPAIDVQHDQAEKNHQP